MDNNVSENELPITFSEKVTEHSLKLKDIVREHINKTYLMCDKNASKTAKFLGISINTVKKNQI